MADDEADRREEKLRLARERLGKAEKEKTTPSVSQSPDKKRVHEEEDDYE